MKRNPRYLLSTAGLILGLLLHPPALNAQEVVDYVTIDSLRVGDIFTFSLTLTKDRDYGKIIYPDSSHFGPSLEMRSRQHYRVTDFRDSLVYQLQFFDTEDAAIPRLPVHLVNAGDTTTVYTTRTPIHFKTVLQSENPEFRPLKPIFDFARAWWPYLLLLLLLGLLGWYLYRYYLQQQAKPEPEPESSFQPTPFSNPLQSLASALKQLRSYSFDTQEDFEMFYIKLGDSIRAYFEELYRIPALESTSREILHDLRRRAADEKLIEKTNEVLREADMVKFARFTPSEEEARRALDKAEDFLDRAREVDSTRIEQKRRRHMIEMQKERAAFVKKQKQEEAEALS